MKLLTFLPCEKIIKSEEGTLSLITLINGVVIKIAEGETLPSDAVTPMEWWLFSAWDFSEEDVDVNFIQCSRIEWPGGHEFVTARVPFTPQKNEALLRRHTTTQRIRGFPVGEAGHIVATAWLERADNGEKASDVQSWTINVKHQRVERAEQMSTE